MGVKTRVLGLRVYKNCCPVILSWVSFPPEADLPLAEKKVLVALTYRLSLGAYRFSYKAYRRNQHRKTDTSPTCSELAVRLRSGR
jgi:hypothetical protein